MALGSTTNSNPRIAPINPANLVAPASAVVEPRAVAVLGDAFRQGVISADDIINRIGEVGQAKKKVELQGATEVTSPQAIALRGQQQQTAMEAAKLGEAQAVRGQVLQQYPAVAYFDKLAPAAGITEPKLPDGTPDYKQMEIIGAELAVDQARKAQAQSELENITTKDTNDGTVISAFTKQGTPVPSSHVAKLRAIATKPFSRQAPGTVETSETITSTAPVVEARSAGPVEDLTVVRTRLANQFGPEVVAGMDEENLRQLNAGQQAAAAPTAAASPLVTPRQSPDGSTAPQVVPAGAPTAGGYSLGNTPKVPAIKGPTEAQQRAQLALSRFSQSENMQAALQEAGYDPTSIGSWMNGMLPQILKNGDRKQYEAATDAWSQGLLRLESGAAISRQEKSWYDRAFFPQVKDPETVVLAKEAMRHDIERMVAEIAQAGGVVSPESAEQTKQIYERANGIAARSTPGTATTKSANGAPVITTSTGRKVTRDKNGNYIYVE